MDSKSKSLFIKLMAMTTSSHDAECLVAIRKANAILAEANVNWEEFLAALDASHDRSHMVPPSKRKQQQQAPSRARQDEFHDVDSKHDNEAEIDALFERVYDRISSGSSFYEFVQSVHDFWLQKGFLTEKQYQAIRRAAR